MKLKDHSGKIVGQLFVIRCTGEQDRHGHYLWLCRCSCGNQTVVPSNDISTGHTKSCGCIRVVKLRKFSTVHGHATVKTRTRTYNSWAGLISRCLNSNNPSYHRWYGAKGITVCERWVKFENFLADMGERPQGTSIDRYPDGNGNYEPGNCRWATASEQARNRRPRSEWKFNAAAELSK